MAASENFLGLGRQTDEEEHERFRVLISGLGCCVHAGSPGDAQVQRAGAGKTVHLDSPAPGLIKLWTQLSRLPSWGDLISGLCSTHESSSSLVRYLEEPEGQFWI